MNEIELNRDRQCVCLCLYAAAAKGGTFNFWRNKYCMHAWTGKKWWWWWRMLNRLVSILLTVKLRYKFNLNHSFFVCSCSCLSSLCYLTIISRWVSLCNAWVFYVCTFITKRLVREVEFELNVVLEWFFCKMRFITWI